MYLVVEMCSKITRKAGHEDMCEQTSKAIYSTILNSLFHRILDMSNDPSTRGTTLLQLHTYDSPSGLANEATNPTFVPCPRLRLNLDKAHIGDPYRRMTLSERQALSQLERANVQRSFIDENVNWINTLRSLPGLDQLLEVRLCFEALLARHVGELVVGNFVRDVTQMLWDGVGRKKVLRVVVEGCESEAWRVRLVGRVVGFDAEAEE